MTDAEYPEVQARINATRAELDSTLAGIEDKLDVKKHLDRLSATAQASYARLSDTARTSYTRYRDKALESYREKPVPWIVGATAVGILVLGTVAWAFFTDDD